MSKNLKSDHRRRAALHVYAVLCVATGLSGVGLSLWQHPGVQAARAAQVADYYQQQTMRATPVAMDADLKKEFLGVDVAVDIARPKT